MKEDWAKLDTKGEGAVTLAEFQEAGNKMQAKLNLGDLKGQFDKEKFIKLLDPEGTGKVTYDNFVKFVKAGLEKLKGP